MKVKELVEQLKKLDQDLEVLGYTEDEEFIGKKHLFRSFDVTHVEVHDAEMSRNPDGTPGLKLGKHEHSQKIASISMTTDV
jgi:hypothetical protein